MPVAANVPHLNHIYHQQCSQPSSQYIAPKDPALARFVEPKSDRYSSTAEQNTYGCDNVDWVLLRFWLVVRNYNCVTLCCLQRLTRAGGIAQRICNSWILVRQNVNYKDDCWTWMEDTGSHPEISEGVGWLLSWYVHMDRSVHCWCKEDI